MIEQLNREKGEIFLQGRKASFQLAERLTRIEPVRVERPQPVDEQRKLARS